MSAEAQYEYREGLRNVHDAIFEYLGKNGIAIDAEGVSHLFTWQPGAPVPSSVRFDIAPIGRNATVVEFSSEQIEDCWEGLDRADVRKKLDEIVGRFTIVDKQKSKPSEQQRCDEAIAVIKMSFPRIHQRIVSLWGTAQGEIFLDGLMVDERGGRQGFPHESMRALLLLQRVHFQKFGTFKKVDPWDIAKF